MKLAFYKAFCDNATLLDIAIGIATLGKYSHVELVFSNGESFSISPRDNGGRFKVIDFDDEYWDLVELDISPEEEELLKLESFNHLGMEYDYIGALFSATPFCIQSRRRIFCSEVVVNILVQSPRFRHLGDGCKYSPSGLSTIINNI